MRTCDVWAQTCSRGGRVDDGELEALCERSFGALHRDLAARDLNDGVGLRWATADRHPAPRARTRACSAPRSARAQTFENTTGSGAMRRTGPSTHSRTRRQKHAPGLPRVPEGLRPRHAVALPVRGQRRALATALSGTLKLIGCGRFP
jgi:hypothetical protein